jgi:hypothetical protein
VYELVDGGKEGVKATSEPTYMEVGGGGNTFQLERNEVYVSTALLLPLHTCDYQAIIHS